MRLCSWADSSTCQFDWSDKIGGFNGEDGAIDLAENGLSGIANKEAGDSGATNGSHYQQVRANFRRFFRDDFTGLTLDKMNVDRINAFIGKQFV